MIFCGANVCFAKAIGLRTIRVATFNKNCQGTDMRAHLRFIGATAIATLTTAAMPVPATAEEYPTRTVSLVVAFPAGGGVDTVGRVVAQNLRTHSVSRLSSSIVRVPAP